MPEMDLIGAFFVGLLGGVHCVGMCGGIVGALSFGLPSQRQWPLLLSYNAGRIVSYTAGAFPGRFERVAEIVVGSSRDAGRARYQFYRDRGFPLYHHELDDWEG